MSKDYRSRSYRLLATAIDAAGSLLPRHSAPAGTIRNVLILKFDRIGDMFLATSAIQALRQCFSDARLALLCAPWNVAVVENCPEVDEVHVASAVPDVHSAGVSEFLSRRRVRALAEEIAALRPDLAIDLQGNPLVVAAMSHALIPYRVGFGCKMLSFLLTHTATYQLPLHQSAVYLSIPRLLGFRAAPSPLQMWPSEATWKRITDRVAELGLARAVVFHLGAGRSYRRWPLTEFRELGLRLREAEEDRPLILIGGAEDEALAQEFSRDLGRSVLNWTGQLSLAETYVLLGTVAAVVANESGPGHLAAAQGTPLVSLMSAWTDIPRWRALGPEVTILNHKAHRCAGPGCRLDPCPNMAAIRAPEVYAALAQRLHSGQDR